MFAGPDGYAYLLNARLSPSQPYDVRDLEHV